MSLHLVLKERQTFLTVVKTRQLDGTLGQPQVINQIYQHNNTKLIFS